MKMDSRTFCVVFSLCLHMHLPIVLAKKKHVRKELENWIEEKDFVGNVKEAWENSKTNSRLFTGLEQGGASWFITPILNLPNTSYLQIEAECTKNPCQLEIYGTNESPVPPEKFKFIQNVTFATQRHFNTTTIKKSYPYLSVLARVPFGISGKMSFFIYSIEIDHYFCEKQTIHNIKLSQVDSSTTNISIRVPCEENAVSSDGESTNITVKCTPKGNWTFSDPSCVCNKGFRLTNNKKGCSRCPVDEYKNIIGDRSECQKCLKNKTNDATHTGCKCKKNHYIGDNEDEPCYGVPSKVEQLAKDVLTNTSINVTWKKPIDDGGFNGSITYSVEVFRCHSACNATEKNAEFSPRKNNLSSTYVIVSNLVFKQYKIKVISMSNLKNVSSEKWKSAEIDVALEVVERPTTKAKAPVSSEPSGSGGKDNNILIYVGVAVGFVVIIAFIIVIIITRYRRGKLKKDGKDNHGFENIPFSQRIYVDPSAYDDPEAALRDFANEISEKNLKLERVIGGGEFGDVYKGILRTEDRGNIEVAAKTLKHDSDTRSRKDFFLEGSAMGQFDDPNVIHLEGVITKSIPHMIVIEYMSNGSLDNFLKKNDGQFTDLQLVGMARGVASGMKYLAAINFIHRDLAARNILVNEGMLCKVADFGLSRELENADSSRGEYCASGGKIPVRWTAPEAIKYRKFSTSSDVWSYGILLWEIMSFGERPYWDWDNFKLLERVDEGYRLPAPKNCPKAVHELMLLCWETSRENRPEFAAIVSMLDEWIRSPETIRYERLSRRPVSGGGVNDPALMIKEWLHDIKMSSYIPHFTQAGFKQLSDLAGLQDNDLQVIGISLIGHRNKMLRTIRSLPITEETKKTTLSRSGSFKV